MAKEESNDDELSFDHERKLSRELPTKRRSIGKVNVLNAWALATEVGESLLAMDCSSE